MRLIGLVFIYLFAMVGSTQSCSCYRQKVYFKVQSCPAHYHHRHDPCRVHSRVVKEINGGSPRYVVDGTYKVCEEPKLPHSYRPAPDGRTTVWYPSQHEHDHGYYRRAFYY